MTGKDLALTVLIAAAAGAGAAAAVAALHEPPPPAVDPAELLARLERLDARLTRGDAAQKESKDALGKLSDKVTGLAIDVNTAREELRTAKAEAAAAAGEASGSEAGTGEVGKLLRGARGGRVRRVVGGPGEGGAEIRIEGLDGLGAELGRHVEGLAKRLEGLGPGLELRALPEAERWEKARTDLGLDGGQVEALQRAVAERDAALKDSMQVEQSVDGENTSLRIRRMDPAKAAAAQQDYDRKVSSTLTADQRAKWDEKGYGHAFGGPSGGLHVMVADTIELDATDLGERK